ncbi:MAG TPA: DNA internalization-related competence protein ComEC/Rec2, partial [Burkholderiaceae bacterium]|nr:DNA internalization-related competence protein ComEC/Rec2 [Burkholderiaceae bacterium]
VDQVARVRLRVASLPVLDQAGWRFDAHVVSSRPAGVPARIRVRWSEPVWRGPYAHPDPDRSQLPLVQPGQLWRMALVLKPVHGNANPGGFDHEGHVFAQGIRAMGKVRGTPWLLSQRPGSGAIIRVQRWRHQIREALQPFLNNHEYGGVLLALSLGDQGSIAQRQWEVFRKTGLAHLVAISGTHVSLIAGLGAAVTAWVWRRLRWRRHAVAERTPVRVAAGAVALILAAVYCLLAGWGIPAQRTFLMLASFIGLLMARVAVASSRLLLVAAFMVVLFDPWAMLSSGFWLSFTAVAILIAADASAGRGALPGPRQPPWRLRLWRHTLMAARIQLLITFLLLGPLAMLFNEISLVSPLANAYAILIISVVVTPLALLAALAVLVPGSHGLVGLTTSVAHGVLSAMMKPTEWLADLPLASIAIAQPGQGAMMIALVSAVMVLLPRGLPLQRLAWLGIFPALLASPPRLASGHWQATALDVGQASAIAVRTANHTLLFDAGLRHHVEADDGDRIIVPFLRHQGWRKLDTLVLSHADLDHVGGLRSVLAALPVGRSLASFDMASWLDDEAQKLGPYARDITLPKDMHWCRRGQQWTVDGVTFEMLWPREPSATAAGAQSSRERNRGSCVLSIRGAHHSLLLTGDINARQEQSLVAAGLRPHDVVLAAHHGSRGSSDRQFVQAAAASHVIMQAGAWSRYGHPHPHAVARWQTAGSRVWRSDHHGAVILCSCSSELEVSAQRQARLRYWHHVFEQSAQGD